jgi:hypothetical protein
MMLNLNLRVRVTVRKSPPLVMGMILASMSGTTEEMGGTVLLSWWAEWSGIGVFRLATGYEGEK